MIKLTDAYINKIKHTDKDQYFYMPNVGGLLLIVRKYPSKSKIFYYQYRPKGKIQLRLELDLTMN